MSKFLRLPKAFASDPSVSSVFVDPDAVTLIVPEGKSTCRVYCQGAGDFALVQGTADEIAERVARAAGPEPLPPAGD